jgi:uncharacterized protein YacL
MFQLFPIMSDKIHTICAASFFTLLAINSIFLFTRTENTTNQKIKRNAIYIACGIIILLCLLGILIAFVTHNNTLINAYKLILIFETIALSVFGISWLVKGQTLFQDN